MHISKITIKGKEYPKQLKNIPNPPKQLYFIGDIELLNKNSIAIIGTRNASENGKRLASKFSKELVAQGIVTVSGMAKGIDAEAHKSTIEAGGKTIAVLGNGLNHIFPPENTNLYQEIIKSGGLVVSEYLPNTPPSSNLFLERNRIVSGISIGVLVVEAAYRSGTSVTAKLAKEQDRKVFVLPHEINDKYGVGTNKLIRKGAILVTSTKEIIKEFDFLEYKEVKISNNKEKTKDKVQKEITFENKEEKEVYELINNGFSNINEIHKKTNMQIQKLNQILFMLEIKGYIKKLVGGYKCT